MSAVTADQVATGNDTTPFEQSSMHHRASRAAWALVSFPDDARLLQDAIDACASIDLDYVRMVGNSSIVHGREGVEIRVAEALTRAAALMDERVR